MSTQFLFVEAQVLPIKLFYESIANLMFDVRNRTPPSHIQDLFQDISNVHSYNTSSSASNNFYTKPSRLSVHVNSFSRIGVKVWNEIPQALRNFSENMFKRELKQHFRFTRLLYRFISDNKKYKVLVIFLCLLTTNIKSICTFNILSLVNETVFLVIT